MLEEFIPSFFTQKDLEDQVLCLWIPQPPVEPQSQFERFPSSHHQVFFAEAVCLMRNAVFLSLIVDNLQLAMAIVKAWVKKGDLL